MVYDRYNKPVNGGYFMVYKPTFTSPGGPHPVANHQKKAAAKPGTYFCMAGMNRLEELARIMRVTLWLCQTYNVRPPATIAFSWCKKLQ